MIKLELEELLEDGFSKRGIAFSRRVYGEEIAVGASVDDVLNKISVEEAKQKTEIIRNSRRGLNDPLDWLLDSIFNEFEAELTRYQYMKYIDLIPFFIRTADTDRVRLVYEVYPTQENSFDSYEKYADEIIKQKNMA